MNNIVFPILLMGCNGILGVYKKQRWSDEEIQANFMRSLSENRLNWPFRARTYFIIEQICIQILTHSLKEDGNTYRLTEGYIMKCSVSTVIEVKNEVALFSNGSTPHRYIDIVQCQCYNKFPGFDETRIDQWFFLSRLGKQLTSEVNEAEGYFQFLLCKQYPKCPKHINPDKLVLSAYFRDDDPLQL